MKFEISQELLQTIANYLNEKPYKEVAGMLSAIEDKGHCKLLLDKKPEQEVKDGKTNDSQEKETT